MKNVMIAMAFILAVTTSITSVNAQQAKTKTSKVKFSKMDASPLDLIIFKNADKQPMARVIYSRPQKKDREVFGKLVPYGKVWRTGANEATEVTFYKDMTVGGKAIEAGTYTLYTIPTEKEWTIILNKATNVWGAYSYNKDMDVLRVNVPAMASSKDIESFSMSFKNVDNGAHLIMGWDTTFVKVPFTM